MMNQPTFRAASHPGYVRSNNEDQYLVLRSEDYAFTLLIMADGMGGHKCGEVASQIAVDQASRFIDEKLREGMTDRQIMDLMERAVELANVHVEIESRSDPSREGMGTTLTLGLIVHNQFFVSHVGDSRIYLLRRDRFEQLTRDDTYVEYLVQLGQISRAEAAHHPKRNLLTKALGVAEPMSPFLRTYRLHPGDRLLFCTDGLYDVLSTEEIKDILGQSPTADRAVSHLIRATLQGGAPDNVSVIVGFL